MSSKHKSGRSGVRWRDLWGHAAYRLIEFGVPNEAGLIIQRHQVDANKDVIGVLSNPDNSYKIRHEEIAASGNTVFMPDGMYLVINPWPGARGDLFRDALIVGADILPAGTGSVDENGYVWDYRLLYFYTDFNYGDKRRNPI